MNEGHPTGARGAITRCQRRVSIELRHILIEAAKRVVIEPPARLGHLAIDHHIGVNLAILISAFVTAKQPNAAIVLPTAIAHRLAKEEIRAANVISCCTVRGAENLQDFVAEFGSHPLVRIDDHHPFMRRLRDGPVLLRRRIDVFMLDESDVGVPGNLERAIRTERIDDEDLVGPIHAIETISKILFLVESGYDDRDSVSFSHAWTRPPIANVLGWDTTLGIMSGQKDYPQLARERLQTVCDRIGAAASRAGRTADDVTLVAVTKKQPLASIESIFEAGQTAFGENRVQEAVAKIDAFPREAEWHFIGHLQRNKAKAIVGRVALIHSVDSVRLIRELEKQAARLDIVQRVLIELNVTGEEAKTGAEPEELDTLIKGLADAPHLKAQGLMTMAPYNTDPEAARPPFARLREILSNIPASQAFDPRHLSMGMSGDFEVAIEEGATLVRIGTVLMGERPGD